MWGVDNTSCRGPSRRTCSTPYESPALDAIPADLTRSCPTSRRRRSTTATCASTTTSAGSPSTSSTPRPIVDDLLEPAYADLLVVENPATSSPGLAFLLATIADVRRRRWRGLLDGADGERRRGGRRLDRGLLRAVLVGRWRRDRSWSATASSPPAEVIFADPPRTDAPTAVVTSTCFRQVEFAGVLDGTDSPDEARALVDFLASERFQRELPLNLFVYPANPAVELPPEFVEFATVPDDSADARPHRHRGEPRRPGSTSGPRSSWPDRGRIGSRSRLPTWFLVALAAAPAVFLVVFYVAPFVTLLAHGRRVDDVGDMLGRRGRGRWCGSRRGKRS